MVLGSAYNSSTALPLSINKTSLIGIKTSGKDGAKPHYYYSDQSQYHERVVLMSSGDYKKTVGNDDDIKSSVYQNIISQCLVQFSNGSMSMTIDDGSIVIDVKKRLLLQVGDSYIDLLPDRINISATNISLHSSGGLNGSLCVVGSQTQCPQYHDDRSPHVGGPIISGSSNVMIADQPVARVGDKAQCHGACDAITTGNTGILVNGRPVAIVQSSTAHGGQVITGHESVQAVDGS